MPPLPVTRISPGRDYRTEINHNRGHSFKFGMTLSATKDDDLALFNDMQIKERESFLLHTSDDFDDSLNIKLGVTIPDRGGRDDLLDADGEKNDYDWLLTPPDTPLFPSLDDEEPQSHKQPIRGRPRSQPISVSRSLAMNEISQKNTRINASPRRLSPSPRSNNNNSFVKSTSRPSSAIRSSPPPVSRPVTPSRRPSTPNRPSTPRSLTPTPKVHGTSPMRSSRGNSASPKIHAWQTNILGFSSDVPPNLRTSLSDRPSPPMRGLSPTPSSGRGRHSMSPTCSRRSVSSSNSNGRDLFSSCSKSSFVSSCDDDVDSLQSVAVPKSSTTVRNRMVGNSKAMGLSKKSTRSLASTSVPKRSFESDIRQSDLHKTQKMFRPLLSSVPTTTFYVGKASNTNRIMFSRNSSLTTNTSASSEQGTSAVGEWEKMHDSAIQDEVFDFDRGDDITDYAEEMPARNLVTDSVMFEQSMSVKVDVPEFDGEDVEHCKIIATCTKCGKCFSRLRLDENIDICEECTKIDDLFAVTELLLPSDNSESIYATKGLSMDDSSEFMKLCSKCGKDFCLRFDGNLVVCEECIKIDGLYDAAKPLLHPTATNNEIDRANLAINEGTLVSDDKLNIDHPEKPCSCNGESLPSHNGCTPEQDAGLTELKCGNNFGNIKLAMHTSLKIDNLEDKGISVLLPCHASNSRSPIIQSTAITTASILCADPSYVRDNASALRRSIEKEITSSTSSIDMGSYKQTDSRIRRQLSGSKYEISSVRCDTDAKSQHSGSYSEFTANTYGSFSPCKTDDGELSVSFTKSLEKEAFLKAVLLNEELDRSLDITDLNTTNTDGSNQFNDEQSALEIKQSCAYNSSDNSKDQTYSACRNVNEEPKKENDATEDISVSNNSEQNVLNDGPSCQSDNFDTSTDSSNLSILESQIELGSSEPDISCEPAHFPSSLEALHKHSIPTVLEEAGDSTLESCFDHNHGIPEESTVIVEGKQGHASRSLTLAEATDTILFCSSIIHDIAYKAASIAIEKESMTHPEASKPTVTIIEKSVYAHRGSMKPNNRITNKPAKFGRKKAEAQTKLPLKESETNVNVEESTPLVIKENIPMKAPDSIKPPKLESKCNCTIM